MGLSALPWWLWGENSAGADAASKTALARSTRFSRATQRDPVDSTNQFLPMSLQDCEWKCPMVRR